MPITLDQIVEETRRWSPQQVAELVDRLTLALNQSAEPEIDNAWKQETRRRVAEIESGSVKGIPGEQVTARLRRIVRR